MQPNWHQGAECVTSMLSAPVADSLPCRYSLSRMLVKHSVVTLPVQGPPADAKYYCSHINAEARGFISTRVHLCRFDRTCLSNESAVSHSLMHSRRRVGRGLDVDGKIFSLFKNASPAKLVKVSAGLQDQPEGIAMGLCSCQHT